jgi:SAM-dependent methyltransferase
MRAARLLDGVMVAASATSPLTVLGSGSLTAYWRFQRAVVAAQLQAWLPPRGRILVDISGPQSSVASQAAAAGYLVLQVMPRVPAAAERLAGQRAARPELPRVPAARSMHRRRASSGRLVRVVADSANLAFLADGSVDGVIADDGALSRHLMAEDVAAEIARVLRPGGQLLACVDSLVLGMSILAEQHHWAELTDLPQAEVVLVPWPDGRITRCFGPEQLVDLLTEAGLEVSWIRPRTLLSPSMVDHVLRKDPSAIMRLVRAELAAGAEDAGPAGAGHGTGGHGNESFGIYLLAAARKPGPREPAPRKPTASRPAAGRPAAGRPAATRPAASPSMSGADRPAAASQVVG